MTNSKTILTDFTNELTLNISEDEKQAIGWLVMEKVLNVNRAAIMLNKSVSITSAQTQQLKEIIFRLNAQEPVQYILEQAWFLSRPFYVNRSVLIPRPETEELVQEVLKHRPLKKILDIGTGSGCIPITLKLEHPVAEAYAVDISEPALAVAQQNARTLGAAVHFQTLDILTETIPFQHLDVVISNPPYIALKEKMEMERHVVDFEPHLALFVTDENPLIFYNVIAQKSKSVLNDNGILLVEINARFGSEVAAIFTALGYHDVTVLKDLTGKDRMVRATKA